MSHLKKFKDSKKLKRLQEKADTWGEKKVNPNALIKAEEGTPWSKFKDEMLQKAQEEKNAKAVDVNSKEAKEHFKKREQVYRKMLIAEKQKQATKWEDFAGNEDEDEESQENEAYEKFKNEKNKPKSPWKNNIERNHNKNSAKNPFVGGGGRQQQQQQQQRNSIPQTSLRADFKRRDGQQGDRRLTGKALFKNFDPKNISTAQNIALTKQLNKEATRRNTSFYTMVEDMKFHPLKAPKTNPFKNT